jgi:hypothetical protein
MPKTSLTNPSLARWLPIIAFFAMMAVHAQDEARLYVDFTKTQSQKAFRIVSKPKVQNELQLTTNQIAEITACERRQPKDISALTNLLAQSRASTNVEDRKRISGQLWAQFAEWQFNCLLSALSPAQSNRFQQIMWQVDGLKSLQHDQTLVVRLGLSQEQIGQVRDALTFYQPILDPLYRRLGRQMIAGLSGDETAESRREQVQSLVGALMAIEKERDRDIRRILELHQRDIWQQLLGRPLRLHWEPQLF